MTIATLLVTPLSHVPCGTFPAELKTGSFASPSRDGFALTRHIHVMWAQYLGDFDFATICLEIAT
jgi:hypothetical protein